MYQLVVPYVMRPDPDTGEPIRTPRVPPDWNWDQATSRCDTGRLVRRRRRAIINVREPRAKVETWMANQDETTLFRYHDFGPRFLAVRNRGATDTGAIREYREESRLKLRRYVREQELLGLAEGSRILIPFILGVGFAAAAAYFGVDPAFVFGITTGTQTWADDAETGWTLGLPSAGGTDAHGATPNVTNDGGTFQNLGVHTSEAFSGTGLVGVTSAGATRYGFSRDNSVSGLQYVFLVYSSSYTNQYIEIPVCRVDLGRGGLIVRMSSTGSGANGYVDGRGTSSLYRYDAGSGTVIATGAYTNNISDATQTPFRMEANGSIIDVYTADGTPTYTLDHTADDSTYSTGSTGFVIYSPNIGGDNTPGWTYEGGTLPATETGGIIPIIKQQFMKLIG